MEFHIINTTRGRHNRIQRAQMPVRGRFKQYLGEEQLRSVRSRPLVVHEDWLKKNLEEVRAKVTQGLIEVRSPDGRLLNLEDFVVAEAAPIVPLPNPPLDSAANDKAAGEHRPQFVGGTTLAEAEERAAALKADEVVDETPEVPSAPTEEEEVEHQEMQIMQTSNKKNRRGR